MVIIDALLSLFILFSCEHIETLMFYSFFSHTGFTRMGLIKKLRKRVITLTQTATQKAIETANDVTDAAKDAVDLAEEATLNAFGKSQQAFGALSDINAAVIVRGRAEALRLRNRLLTADDTLKQRSRALLAENREAFTAVFQQMERLEARSPQPNYMVQLHSSIRDQPAIDVVRTPLRQASVDPDFIALNQSASSIGPFQTWSYQGTGEANAVLGVSGNLGYVHPISQASTGRSMGIVSSDYDAGYQFGITGGITWGWWKALPQSLSGFSIMVSLTAAYYAGVGVTFYWDVKREDVRERFQGFAATFGSGLGVEGAAGIGATYVFE